jgi:uncharacterized protein
MPAGPLRTNDDSTRTLLELYNQQRLQCPVPPMTCMLPPKTWPLLASLLASAPSALAQRSDVAPSEGASFDCQRARGKIAKQVCADPQLVALDRRASELLALASTQVTDPAELRRNQRRWLRERDHCKAVACLLSSYETRVRQLETFTGELPAATVRDLCTRLASPETRSQTLAANAGSDDINNDGIAETATQCAGGSANFPCVSYLVANGKPLQIQPQGFDWARYSPLGRTAFRFDDRTFIYYSADAALDRPSHLTYVTPTNQERRMCEFEAVTLSVVAEGGDDVCYALESEGGDIDAIELHDIAVPSPAWARDDTFARRRGSADIDNDGLEEELIELRYESGAGQGCTFNYFELLAPDGRSLAATSKAAPVRELQGISPDGYRERNCGNIENRLFKFREKVYLETNANDNERVPHEVRMLNGTAVASVCTLESVATTRVKQLFVE